MLVRLEAEPGPVRPHWMDERAFTHALRDAPDGNEPLARPIGRAEEAAYSGTGYCVYETYFSEVPDPRGL